MMIYEKKIVKCSQKEVANLFWDIHSWSKIWNPIEQIEMIYDDGFNQEFIMRVWRDKLCETVRVVRFKIENSIFFFTPISPPMMKTHAGSWKFTALSKDLTCIEAHRSYELKSSHSDENFQRNFSNRVLCILEVFKKHFEASQEVPYD